MKNEEILRRAARLAGEGRPFVLASVVAREPPVSARPGALAVVEADGSFHGWLGGSCIEPTVRSEAALALETGEPRLVVFAPDGEADRPRAVVHPMTCHSGGTVEVFLEPQLPEPVLALYGDSPVNRALAAMAPAAGYRVRAVGVEDADAWTGVEVRERGEDPAAPGGGDRAAGEARRGADDGPAGETFAVVATMGEWDEDAAREALATGAGYVGLVASPRRAQAVRETLAAGGTDPGDRLVSPAGLDLGAREPGEIAVTILAELVERRRGGVESEADGSPAAGSGADPDRTGAPSSGDPAPAPGSDGDDAAAPVDPVCGMTVSDEDAPRAEHEGAVYRFCCEGCRARFEAEPDRYAAAGDAS